MAVNIRDYEHKDEDRAVEAVIAELAHYPHYAKIKPDAQRLRMQLRLIADRHSSSMKVFVLTDDEDNAIGALAAYCVEQFASRDKMTNDLFFFILPEHRSLQNATALLNAYRIWALAQGATVIALTVSSNYRLDGIDKLMHVLGFERVGALYYLGSV